MGKKLMINCDEATAICDKNQYGEASKWDKIRLYLHLLFCKYCKAYSKQNHLITKMMGKYLHSHDGYEHLSENDKAEIKIKLKNQQNK